MIWMPKLLYFSVWRNWLLFSCSLQKQLRKNKKKTFRFSVCWFYLQPFFPRFPAPVFPQCFNMRCLFFSFFIAKHSVIWKRLIFNLDHYLFFPRFSFFNLLPPYCYPPFFFSFKPIMFTTFNRLCSENIRCFFF